MGTTIFPLLLLVIFIGGGYVIGYMIIKAISRPSEGKSKGKLQELRSGIPDVRKILGEMRFIAEETFDMYEEYEINKAKAKSISYGLSHFGRQNELLLAMNRNVKEEWVPRFKFLKEIQNSFYKDNDLYNAFIEFRIIDNDIRKLTLLNMNIGNYGGYITKAAKIALKGSAIMSIATVVVGGAMLHMVNKAGRDMFTSLGNSDKWIDRETGKEYDHNPVNDL